jgi:hypothetical protein
MKKVNAFVLGLAVLLTVGCGGNDEEKNDPTPADPLQKECFITKEVRQDYTIDYIYNAGKLIRANFIKPDPVDSWYIELTYNASGKIADMKYFDSKNVQDMQFAYTYNADNLPDTVFTAFSSQMSGYTKYEYNSAKKLVKRSAFNTGQPIPFNYTDISYPAVDQSKEMLYTRDAGGNMVLHTTQLIQYDNKKHPHSQLGVFDETLLASPNNILSVSTTFHTLGTNTSSSLSYTYNAEGYPTQLIGTSGQNGSQSTVNFSYNCN